MGRANPAHAGAALILREQKHGLTSLGSLFLFSKKFCILGRKTSLNARSGIKQKAMAWMKGWRGSRL